MSEILQYLQQALDAANATGDVDTIAAIAALMKKVNAAGDTPEPAPMPPTAATTPLEAAPTEAPQPTGPLYQAAQNALQELYPNHEYLGEDNESVTISVTDEQGVETTWRIPVTVDADGNATLGEPAVEGDVDAEQVRQAREWLEKAIARHQRHMTGEEPTTEESQREMMEEMQKALDVLADGTAEGTAEPGTEPAPAPSQPPPTEAARTLNAPNKPHRRALLSQITPKLLEEANARNELWVNIVNLGEYEHPEYGTITFTEEHYKQWKANLERGVMGGRCEDGRPCIATDYGHAMDENLPPEMQKASGYIKDLKLEGNRVYALVEFTPRALEGIKNKEWSWFSVSVVDSLLDQRTGQDVGSALLGGALTNRPYIPDLEPIRLTDLRPSRATQLQRELAAREVEIARLKREKYDAEVKATLAALEQARIPPSVLGLVRPLLEADYEAKPTIKLARGGREQHLTPGKAAIEALMELARVGLVPAGERTGKPTDPGGITLEQAVAEVEAEWQKAGKRNYRRKDLYLAARRKYPHLREN